MIEQVRKFLASSAGKVTGILCVLALLAISFFSLRGFINGETPPTAFYTTYICTETGKSFRHENQIGETIPILSPYSGKTTGLPAEACYWTPSGGILTEPTWVLLNSQLGKPEPTFCPYCGRLVVQRNPMAQAGHAPPPTREEWTATHSTASP